MSKMETRIRELESELDAESRRLGDAQKNMRKSERRVKELIFAGEEDKKNQERMQALVDQLQSKIKTYKKQIEEAEEIAALNLAKVPPRSRSIITENLFLFQYRQVQGNVCAAIESADISEQSAARYRTRARSTSAAPVSISIWSGPADFIYLKHKYCIT